MREITWDEEARCELRCSTLYLAERGGKELAQRFVMKVESAILSAQAMPQQYRKQGQGARCVRVDRFPYLVVFWHDEDTDSIHILAIAHTSRDPAYWRDRLDKER